MTRTSLTLDVEEQSVALAVRHHVGGDAGVEAGLVGVDGLEDEGLVTKDDATGHILVNSLSLRRRGIMNYSFTMMT